jgi:hypothetical protein
MRTTSVRRWWWIGALVAAMACGSGGRTDYFTFGLDDFPLGGELVRAYIYVPVSPESPSLTVDPCWLIEFDLQGHSIREVDGNRTTDDAEQPSVFPGSYLHYLGDENGEVIGSCVSDIDARFGFGGSIYTFRGDLPSGHGFGDLGAITIVPGENAWSFGTWQREGDPDEHAAGFWPYEYSATTSANSVRIYPTEPTLR